MTSPFRDYDSWLDNRGNPGLQDGCGVSDHQFSDGHCIICGESYDEWYATMQAENNAAADLDPNWPMIYENDE